MRLPKEGCMTFVVNHVLMIVTKLVHVCEGTVRCPIGWV